MGVVFMGGYDDNKLRLEELNSFGKSLARRCKSHCELCGKNTALSIYEIPPVDAPDIEKCIMICSECSEQVNNMDNLDEHYWHCLNETAWSEVPGVQVIACRLLKKLDSALWAQDLLEQLYLDEEIINWAESLDGTSSSAIKTLDSNGIELKDGDSVQIIKDLDVKGAGFVAKRGTLVKNITLTSNPEHIEGKVNKTKLVLKTCFLKKC
jgi:protein PhnA